MSDENQTPASASVPVSELQSTPAPETPVVESKESVSVESKSSKEPSTKTESAVQEVKAELAADKVGAEKVAADKFELKVDGEVLTLTKEEMIKYAQLGKAGQKRMQEAIEFQKQTKDNWERLQRALKENPEEVLEDENIGHKKYDLAKKWLAEEMQEKAKSPEQKELEAERKKAKLLEDRLTALEKEKQEALQRQQEEAEMRETQVHMEKMEKEIVDAFSKHKLPNSKAMLDRIVGIYEFSKNHGIPATMEDCAKVIKDEIKADLQQLAQMLPEEEFEAMLGEAAINKVKAHTLKKKKSVNNLDTAETAKVKKEEVKVKPKISIDDWITPDWAKD